MRSSIVRSNPTPYKARIRLWCTIQLLAVALLLAACGGSTATGSATAPVAQHASDNAKSGAAATATHDVITSGTVTQRSVKGTGGKTTNDENPGTAGTSGTHASTQSNPCTLVSKAEAEAIVGAPIADPREAPLGPTCIYQRLDAKSSVTLAVETVDFVKIKPQIHNLTRTAIAGRTAYCGYYGRTTTFVPLSTNRALAITARCSVGTRFAAQALPRLQS